MTINFLCDSSPNNQQNPVGVPTQQPSVGVSTQLALGVPAHSVAIAVTGSQQSTRPVPTHAQVITSNQEPLRVTGAGQEFSSNGEMQHDIELLEALEWWRNNT